MLLLLISSIIEILIVLRAYASAGASQREMLLDLELSTIYKVDISVSLVSTHI